MWILELEQKCLYSARTYGLHDVLDSELVQRAVPTLAQLSGYFALFTRWWAAGLRET